MKRIFTRYFIFHLQVLYLMISISCFFSCHKNEVDVSYKINGLKATNCDNSGSMPVDTNYVNENAYVINLDYVDTVLFGNPSNPSGYDHFYFESTNKPTSITVSCGQNFDANHPANSSMNDLFIPGPGIYSHLNDIVDKFQARGDGFAGGGKLWLMKPPANPGMYNFKITMSFNDASTFTTTTLPVNLHP